MWAAFLIVSSEAAADSPTGIVQLLIVQLLVENWYVLAAVAALLASWAIRAGGSPRRILKRLRFRLKAGPVEVDMPDEKPEAPAPPGQRGGGGIEIGPGADFSRARDTTFVGRDNVGERRVADR